MACAPRFECLAGRVDGLRGAVEAQFSGVFTAMPARLETMYDSDGWGSSGSFRLTVEPAP